MTAVDVLLNEEDMSAYSFISCRLACLPAHYSWLHYIAWLAWGLLFLTSILRCTYIKHLRKLMRPSILCIVYFTPKWLKEIWVITSFFHADLHVCLLCTNIFAFITAGHNVYFCSTLIPKTCLSMQVEGKKMTLDDWSETCYLLALILMCTFAGSWCALDWRRYECLFFHFLQTDMFACPLQLAATYTFAVL